MAGRRGHEAILIHLQVRKRALYNGGLGGRELVIERLEDFDVHIEVDAAIMVKNQVTTGIGTENIIRISLKERIKPWIVLLNQFIEILIGPKMVFKGRKRPLNRFLTTRPFTRPSTTISGGGLMNNLGKDHVKKKFVRTYVS